MKIHKFSFDQVNQFSKRDKAYANENPSLRPFYKYSVQLDSFPKVIEHKSKEDTNRKVLVDVLKQQYSKLKTSNSVNIQLDKLLNGNTFTIITAHQPSLFTGPLYYIYKIISAINLCKKLKETYPDYNFVPVFITGGEDHDFEEVNHINLFNKKLIWESGEKGSVGEMNTKSLEIVLNELKEILGNSEHATTIFQKIQESHTKNSKYSDAIIEFAHELFQEEGLVILNMNHSNLKRLFIPIIKEEIMDQASFEIVNNEIQNLGKAGFSAQASPRKINFFYLKDQLRERIIKEDRIFKVLNTEISFSEKEMENEIEKYPERFSPNVIVRPLFQEFILPNLAYIGGGGELAYWMERQTQFQHFGINFPMLIRRDSVLWIDKGNYKKMTKLNLSVDDLLKDTEDSIKEFVNEHSEGETSLDQEKNALKRVFENIAEKTTGIEKSLVQRVWAEHAKQLKALEQIETRLIRAEKQKHEVAINQIRSLKEKLFPGNGLQERHDNFLSLYIRYGDTFFNVLLENLDPLEKKFTVILDE